MVYNLIIKFKDSSIKVMKNVTSFNANYEGKLFVVEKNGYNSFFPMENIIFIGREFDLKDE